MLFNWVFFVLHLPELCGVMHMRSWVILKFCYIEYVIFGALVMFKFYFSNIQYWRLFISPFFKFLDAPISWWEFYLLAIYIYIYIYIYFYVFHGYTCYMNIIYLLVMCLHDSFFLKISSFHYSMYIIPLLWILFVNQRKCKKEKRKVIVILLIWKVKQAFHIASTSTIIHLLSFSLILFAGN